MSFETFEHEGAKARLYPSGPEWEGRSTACIGNWSCTSVTAGQTLIDELAERARALGKTALIGPMDGDTWHSYRSVSETDGSAPFLMEPTSGPHDLAAFEQAGFAPIAEYFSARAPIEAGLTPVPPHDPDIRITPWDGNDPEGHFGDVYDLSLAAFAGNRFYKPISREEFLAMYMPYVPMLRPELLLFARDDMGMLTGFLFGIPNYAEGLKSRTAILKTYASLRPGVGQRLAHTFHVAAAASGMEQVIHALIEQSNLSAERSRQSGGSVFRRYALFGRTL